MNKTTQFRQLLAEPGPILLAGVHDGLSACLAEQAGFDAAWASGFCISTSKRIPDVGLVTMTEFLEVAAQINHATTFPVIADVDDGFGDHVNVARTVREYERSGAAGICMEDSRHPKRNSLNPRFRSRLVSAEEFAVKIRVAKAAQSDPDFVVMARTEALIADLGMDEAVRRATAYATAGADLIVVHSRAATPAAIREFGARWEVDVPLVAIPTTYGSISAGDLYECGYKVVIFANQGLRAAITAMKRTFLRLAATQTVSSVSDLCSLEEVFALVNYDEVRRIESCYDGSANDESLPPSPIVA